MTVEILLKKLADLPLDAQVYVLVATEGEDLEVEDFEIDLVEGLGVAINVDISAR